MGYSETFWRKRLERKNWVSLRRAAPPGHKLIEFHIIWKGQLFSGRIAVNRLNAGDMSTPGTVLFLIRRTDQITEGVWRLSAGGETGVVRRPWQK
ncbi:hypothetical protein CZ787_06285 [Halomonas citrativorans]|uniref:Uncharacterized protein n=1 Tax=Halomonas citrativorans TaxID=2742612 RepID=A0A1R4HVS9_9GAMM|nr:hypothetical protein [Halomonas citrativorans]SJN11598.1 hypothetical protein CZ787_06285 [Halomonas citrativorans]